MNKVKFEHVPSIYHKGHARKILEMESCITNMVSDLQIMTDLCYGLSRDAGWWTDLSTGQPLKRNKGEMIALIHSEVSEALEGARKDIMDDHLPHRKMEEVELADTIIRILDYAGGFGLDVAGAMFEKLIYNTKRADHKLENRQKEGGKKI